MKHLILFSLLSFFTISASAQVGGCTFSFACNYDPGADYLDLDLCDFTTCAGCMDETSCTYDPSAIISAPDDCTYPVSQFVNCDGNCISNMDFNYDGVIGAADLIVFLSYYGGEWP